MKVKNIVECCLGAFCNTFEVSALEKTLFGHFESGCFTQVLLYWFLILKTIYQDDICERSLHLLSLVFIVF